MRSKFAALALSWLAVALVGSGCATAPEREHSGAPAPVDAQQEPVPGVLPETTIEPPAPAESSVPAPTGSAVRSLMTRAEEARGEGDTARAAATLERALRIDPRNAPVWHQLAVVRFEQGNYSLAETLAVKSISLAGPDTMLKKSNWNLIADIRRETGDRSGERDARARAVYMRP